MASRVSWMAATGRGCVLPAGEDADLGGEPPRGWSTLLGIIGGGLSWLVGWSTSRAQWKREERCRLAERRIDLYEDTLVYMDRIQRTRYRNELGGKHGARPTEFPDEQVEEDRSTWNARVELHASRGVRDLWETWTFAGASNAIDAHEARTALIARMRAEVSPA